MQEKPISPSIFPESPVPTPAPADRPEVALHQGMPKAGDYLLIKGLRYKIEFADFVRGHFKVTLICLDK